MPSASRARSSATHPSRRTPNAADASRLARKEVHARSFFCSIVACCLLGWPIRASAETDGIRIPRGDGLLARLMMEQSGLIDWHARALGAPNLRVDWLKLGGPAV